MADADLIGMTTHAVAAGGGAGLIGLIARTLITNWIKTHEERATHNGEVLEDVAKELKGVAVELGKVGVRLETLDKSVASTVEHGKEIAVLGSRMRRAEESINGLGKKLRLMEGT